MLIRYGLVHLIAFLAGLPPSVRLEPGEAKGYEGYPIFLGPPPDSIEAPKTTLSSIEIFVVQAK